MISRLIDLITHHLFHSSGDEVLKRTDKGFHLECLYCQWRSPGIELVKEKEGHHE